MRKDVFLTNREDLAMKTTHPKKDMYAQVTEEIITLLESGRTSQITWARTGTGMPCNHKTRIPYKGVNVLLLWAAALKNGYSTDRWLTYKQAAEMGGQVRKGEKSVACVFFKMIEKEKEDRTATSDEEIAETIPVIAPFWLFNLDQIDGIEKPTTAAQLDEFRQIEAAEIVLRQSGAVIREKGDKAFYRPSTDEIQMPARTSFKSEMEFYSVALHELTHWTGAKHRLNRDFSGRFGTEAYAFEELIAELGSAFLNAELGFIASMIPNHAGYLESWLKVLKNDKRAIFTAAAQAGKAHRYIMDLVEVALYERKVA